MGTSPRQAPASPVALRHTSLRLGVEPVGFFATTYRTKEAAPLQGAASLVRAWGLEPQRIGTRT